MDLPRTPPSTDRPASTWERVTVLPQHLLPQLLLSSLMHRFATTRWAPLKDAQVAWFARHYGVNLAEAAEPDPRRYPTLNAFFTRALRPGVRPLATLEHGIVAPADGVISAIGQAAGAELLQAKGRSYTLADLLGAEADAAPFAGGSYLTVYLSPRDYHRVHMPAAGTLVRLRYLPGRLLSVNASTTRVIPRLYARNERVVAHFESDVGRIAVVLVGALLVGGIETVWSGSITPPHGQTAFLRDYPRNTSRLARGEEMGRFNMGSTVVVLFEPGRVQWLAGLEVGTRIQMGSLVGLSVGPTSCGHAQSPSAAPQRPSSAPG